MNGEGFGRKRLFSDCSYYLSRCQHCLWEITKTLRHGCLSTSQDLNPGHTENDTVVLPIRPLFVTNNSYKSLAQNNWYLNRISTWNLPTMASQRSVRSGQCQEDAGTGSNGKNKLMTVIGKGPGELERDARQLASLSSSAGPFPMTVISLFFPLEPVPASSWHCSDRTERCDAIVGRFQVEIRFKYQLSWARVLQFIFDDYVLLLQLHFDTLI